MVTEMTPITSVIKDDLTFISFASAYVNGMINKSGSKSFTIDLTKNIL